MAFCPSCSWSISFGTICTSSASILGSHLPLDIFAHLSLYLAKFAPDLGAEFLIDLENLQFRLGDPACRLRLIGDFFATLAAKCRGLGLQAVQPLHGDDTLFPEGFLRDDLGLQNGKAIVIGNLLRLQAFNLVLELGDALG